MRLGKSQPLQWILAAVVAALLLPTVAAQCASDPCQNGGTCTDDGNVYTCTCPPGFSGPECQTNINECSSDPCQNAGTCIDNTNSFTCTCAAGFSGTVCETNINECASDPCQNAGTCVDNTNGFTCVCAAGFSGNLCETNINECASDPCQNGGTCVDNTNSFTCTCAAGFSGTLCETNINECASDPCANGGTCVDGINGFSCLCAPGFIGDTCSVDENECEPAYLCAAGSGSPSSLYALNRHTGQTEFLGTLENVFGCSGLDTYNGTTYVTGQATAGVSTSTSLFRVDIATTTATLVGLAQGTSGNCQGNIADIEFRPADGTLFSVYVNSCLASINRETAAVTEIDNNFPTGTGNGMAFDASGSTLYIAYPNGCCPTDLSLYTVNPGDGSQTLVALITPIPADCTVDPRISAFTQDTRNDTMLYGILTCGGAPRYLVQVNRFTAEMEVLGSVPSASDALDFINVFPCSNNATCVNTPGSFTCVCLPGFSGAACQTDINECASAPCMNGGTCVDHINAFTCVCVAGFSGTLCETDINECSSGPCINLGTCVDNLNGFTCLCPSGFSGSTCQTDINECASEPCRNGGTCEDLPGGYGCLCPVGFTGIQCETDVNECASNPCQNCGTCIDQPGGYTCLCIADFSGAQCQTQINDCVSEPCANGGTCVVPFFNCSAVAPVGGCSTNADCGDPSGSAVRCCPGTGQCYTLSPSPSPPICPCTVVGDCGAGITPVQCIANQCTLTLYTCICPPGTSGINCETDLNECASDPCQNGGICVDQVNGFTCTCQPGFSGTLCQTNINECGSSPCQNGATCVDQINGFSCTCAPGFIGTLCQTDINECMTGYICNSTIGGSSSLYRLERVSGSTTFIGTMPGVEQCSGLDVYNGVLYAVGANTLFTVNPQTAMATVVGSISTAPPCVQNVADIEFRQSDGALFATQFNSGDSCIIRINPSTGARTVLSTGNPAGGLGLAFDAAGTTLYLGAGTSPHTIYTVDQTTGTIAFSTTVDASLCGAFTRFNGMTQDPATPSVLYAILNCGSGSSGPRYYVTVNPLDGSVGLISSAPAAADAIDLTNSTVCANNGVCANTFGGFNCTCPPGFTGTLCQTNINECASNPCQNGGTCVDEANGFHCINAPGFHGPLGQFIDQCFFNPDICVPPSVCTPVQNTFVCNCSVVKTAPCCFEYCDLYEYRFNDADDFLEVNSGVLTNIAASDFTICLWGRTLPPGGAGNLPFIQIGPNNAANTLLTFGFLNNNLHADFGNPPQTPAPLHVEVNSPPLLFTDNNHWHHYCVVFQLVAPGPTTNVLTLYHDDAATTGSTANNPDFFHGATGPIIIGGAPEILDDIRIYNIALTEAQIDAGYHLDQWPSGASLVFHAPFNPQNGSREQVRDESIYNKGQLVVHGGAEPWGCTFNCSEMVCENGGTCLDQPCNSTIDGNICLCPPGFTGKFCQNDLDECASNPCQNGGTCTDVANAFVCACAPGFSGLRCETNINECASNPCANGGTCFDAVNSFTCTCPLGFSGAFCQTDINECASEPCTNGGTCIGAVNGFTCICPPGFSGTFCQTNINECGSAPCLNGGTCVDNGNQFICQCPAGFSGAQCQTNINECGSSPCANGGTCFDLVNGFFCTCVPGFSGAFCQTEIDECASQPCPGQDTCVDLVNGYNCACRVAQFEPTCLGFCDPNEIRFPTSNDYLLLQNATCGHFFTDTSFTVCLWAKPQEISSGHLPFLQFGPNTAAPNDFLFFGFFDRRIHMHFDTDDVVSLSSGIQHLTNDVNCFHHYCAVFERPNLRLTFYRDNNQDTTSGFLADFFRGSGGPLTIGGFPQKMDEVRIYDRALSPSEISNGFFGNVWSTDGLQLYLPFNDQQGTTVSDESPNDCQNITFVGNPEWTGCTFNCSELNCQNNSTCNVTDTGPCSNGAVCVCPPGFSGRFCESNINECVSFPCTNGGTCQDQVNGFFCICPPGFSGTQCQTNINECASAPCANGGTCFDQVNGFQCVCPPGFSGPQCLTDINECASLPCANAGTCVDFVNSFLCICPPGFSGLQCQTNIDDCASRPCRNGGTCIDINSYMCICPPGYSGVNCETDINECASAPCANGGTCVDFVNAFQCLCLPGFSGPQCQTDINECASNPCQHCGTCIDLVNAFTCICEPGFTGTNCENQTLECASDPCRNGATCIEQFTAFTCVCPCGFSGTFCQTNINECASNPCTNGGTCLDHVNGFECICPPGFQGPNCDQPIDHCANCTQCHNGGTCVNQPTGFFCICPPGFSGPQCQTEINECASAPCQNGGTCFDLVNGFSCCCPPGFTGVLCQTDVNECATNNGGCSNGTTCIDTPGSHFCGPCPSCPVEFDDCASQPCVNGGTCFDRPGGYDCCCPPGFTGVNCQTDINECATNNGGCPTNTVCTNTPGSFTCGPCPGCPPPVNECLSAPCQNGGTCTDGENSFTCCCPPGFTGVLCQTDINECATNNGGCPTNTVCTNTPGSFTCGPCPGANTTCPGGINECATNNGGCYPGTTCTDNFCGRTCSPCPPGFVGANPPCVDVNECATNNGGCPANCTCINTPGSRECCCFDVPCPSGFERRNGTCQDINECATANGCCDTRTICINTNGSRICGPCPRGFDGTSGDLATGGCRDRNECQANNGGCHSLRECVNTEGSRVCCPCPHPFEDAGPTGCKKPGDDFCDDKCQAAKAEAATASGSSSGGQVGAIVGTVIPISLLAAIGGGFIYYRRHQQQQQSQSAEGGQPPPPGGTVATAAQPVEPVSIELVQFDNPAPDPAPPPPEGSGLAELESEPTEAKTSSTTTTNTHRSSKRQPAPIRRSVSPGLAAMRGNVNVGGGKIVKPSTPKGTAPPIPARSGTGKPPGYRRSHSTPSKRK